MSDSEALDSDEWRRFQAVKRAHEGELLRLPNVVGVGIGLQKRHGKPTGELALVVMVSRKVPSAELAPEERIPAQIGDVPVDVQEMGEPSAQGSRRPES